MRAVWVVLVLLLAGCAGDDALQGQPQADTPDVSRVSFVPAVDAGMEALLTGTLGGDPASGCLWVEGGDGDPVPLVLQHDTAVLDTSVDPPVVRAGEEVLAAFGDAVDVAGGFASTSGAGCEELGQGWLGHDLAR